MDLTGKCKEDFYNFITKGFEECDFARDMIVNDLKFKTKTELNALIIEFFDSVGYKIGFIVTLGGYIETYININKFDVVNIDERFLTRQGATQQAIKTAKEIYNNL